MNPDEEAEAALREAYGKRLSQTFQEFFLSLSDIPQLTQEAAARLFSSHGSFPAYSVWRGRVMGTEKVDLPRADLGKAEGQAPSPGNARLRAVQILGGERTTRAEWDRLVKAFPGRRLKGEDHKWNLTEEEIAGALR